MGGSDELRQTRDEAAALKLMKRLMKRYGKPETVVTDGLRSYGAAMKEIGNADRQEVGRWVNNRAENSHQPFRRRERAMERFRRMKKADGTFKASTRCRRSKSTALRRPNTRRESESPGRRRSHQQWRMPCLPRRSIEPTRQQNMAPPESVQRIAQFVSSGTKDLASSRRF